MNKNKKNILIPICITLAVLAIIAVSALLIVLNTQKNNITKYKYAALFIKRKNINNRWRTNNSIIYFDEQGKRLGELDIYKHDFKDQFLSNYLITEKNIYVYGDKGIYLIDKKNLEIKQYNEIKYISAMQEDSKGNIYFVENTGFNKDGKYINSIYKNKQKIKEVEGTISNFLAANDKIYYQSIEINKNRVSRFLLDLNNLEIRKIEYDKKGFYTRIGDNIYVMSKDDGKLFDIENNKIIESDGNISKKDEYPPYFNNKSKKTYYGKQIVEIHNNKAIYKDIEDKENNGNKTFLKERDKYIEASFNKNNDGILNIKNNKYNINNPKQDNILMTFFEKP